MKRLILLTLLFAIVSSFKIEATDKLQVLIIDGQNKYKHAWAEMTPMIQGYLEETGLFEVRVATTPPIGSDMSPFKPSFSGIDVVLVNNYDADPWPKESQVAFEKFVREGGGFVAVHSTDNAFLDWPEFQEMIAVGGWGGRNQDSGPYIRWRDGKMVIEQKPGNSGHHGPQHEFVLVTRTPNHPVMKGMPESWLHSKDELYDCLRGPAKNVTLLATAYSAPESGGTSENEPMIMAITYGKGRVLHTPMGHSTNAMECVGFITTIQRGTEWAATGKVTQKMPDDFPTLDTTRIRPATASPN